MVSRYETREELAEKIDWEGGTDAFMDYGFSESDIDGEADPELWAVSVELIEAYGHYVRARDKFENLLFIAPLLEGDN